MAIPPATAPCIVMHASHPSPSSLVQQRAVDLMMRTELVPRAHCLHHIVMSSAVQFPELRLIQYDCGKSFLYGVFSRLYCCMHCRLSVRLSVTKCTVAEQYIQQQKCLNM